MRGGKKQDRGRGGGGCTRSRKGEVVIKFFFIYFPQGKRNHATSLNLYGEGKIFPGAGSKV